MKRQKSGVGSNRYVLFALLLAALLGAIALVDVPQAKLKEVFMVSLKGEVIVYKRKGGGYYLTAVLLLDRST